jgi:hypothetical protein
LYDPYLALALSIKISGFSKNLYFFFFASPEQKVWLVYFTSPYTPLAQPFSHLRRRRSLRFRRRRDVK